MIKIIDNFLTEEEYNLVKTVENESGYKLESDGIVDTICTGMSLDLFNGTPIYKIFSDKLKTSFDEIKNLNIYRMYVNHFAPLEWPYYHTDTEDFGYTCLYYLNDLWEINDGGETHFYIDNEIIAIPPIPNRVVCFDSTILHKATSFRNKHRFTVAIKYK
jgi:hypothetical protein